MCNSNKRRGLVLVIIFLFIEEKMNYVTNCVTMQCYSNFNKNLYTMNFEERNVEKGKPSEKAGRKASGLRLKSYAGAAASILLFRLRKGE